MKYTALKTNVNYIAGKSYELDSCDPSTLSLLKAGIIEPFIKAKRTVKVTRPAETK